MYTHTTHTCCFLSKIHFNFLNQSKDLGERERQKQRQRDREFLASGEALNTEIRQEGKKER